MATPTPVPAANTRRFTLDPARSSAEFAVKHFWGLITVRGRFERFAGSYDGDRIELAIDAASLDTGNSSRDKHLRSADFFGTDTHPQVRFISSSVTKAREGSLMVRGELEAAGKLVPLDFDATIREVDDHIEIEATTSIDHRLFGMTWSPLGTVRPPATLHVKAWLRST